MYGHVETQTESVSLSFQSRHSYITCVKLLGSVDYLVAVGANTGLLYVFQLPSHLPGRNKQVC